MFEKMSSKGVATLATVFLGAIVGLALPGPSAQTTQPSTDQNQNPPTTYQPGANTPDNRAYAEPNNNTSRRVNGTSPAKDFTFAKNAAEGGMAEVKLGQLAEEKGQSAAVRDFGKRMVNDHSKIDDRLQKVAQDDNITLPTHMSPQDKQTYDRLMKLDGAAFDHAYSQAMVADHRMDIAAFKNESANGADRLIKDFASNNVPTLQSHLEQAQQMRTAVGTSANTRTGQE